ncbi:hypothetical protein [Sporosarcina limicola]|uniref:Positive regulator of sigma E activity n=1 Tax=Sporosarcina limicola TaxID=34101 RepID=A0A927MQX1_9BACL|nr:hypothetical protein [Sporosarcina limicola]MBE1555731.1 positive regulator of sigma E activity [Sporosarcina limicola]
MKLYHHLLIIAVIVTLIIFLYNDGFGAIPFLLAGIYLGFICVKEYRNFKKSKR